MKSIFYLLTIALNAFTSVQANDHLLKLMHEAESFMLAHDYDKASSIFEELVKEALPDWQHALVIYNLGTVKLAQQKNEDALHYYGLVSFDAASTPQIIRSLYINKGIAFLNKAQNINFSASSYELEEEMELYRESLNQFKKAEDLDCRLKILEGDVLSAPCQTLSDIQILVLKAKIGLQQSKHEYIVNSLKMKPVWACAMLVKSMQKLDEEIQIFRSFQIPEKQLKEYQHYLLQQAESFQIIWEQVLKLPFNAKQKSAVNEAATSYQKTLESIQKMELIQASEKIKEALNSMEIVNNAFEDFSLQHLLLNYQLILLNGEWTSAELEKLKVEQLKLNEENQDIIKLANEHLNTSILNFNSSREKVSEFYLLAAFQTLNQLSFPKQVKPTEILEEVLQKAWNAKKLTVLYSAISENQTEAQSIVGNIQQHVVDNAKLFIPAVLAYEKKAFKSKDPRAQRCQQQPWERVIPLFDKGYQSSLAALAVIKESVQALENQINSINDWRDALRLLTQSSQTSAINLKAENPNQGETSTDINEILRLLQEMQAQDQPKEQSSDKELHTW